MWGLTARIADIKKKHGSFSSWAPVRFWYLMAWRCRVILMTSYLCVLSVPVAYCSHRGLEYPRPNSIGSGSTASTTISQSSSSSGRGSLPPIGYLGSQSQGAEGRHAVCSSSEALAENELNHLHLRQHHLHQDCEKRKIGRLFLRMLTCFLSRNIYHIWDYHSVTSAINEYNYSRARNSLEPNLHFSIAIKYILNKKKRLLSYFIHILWSISVVVTFYQWTAQSPRETASAHSAAQSTAAFLPLVER